MPEQRDRRGVAPVAEPSHDRSEPSRDNGHAARSRATRERILRAAERLFAQQGIHAVSLRQIAAVAGQNNHLAVQYHFGSKEALIQAILERRLAAVEELRRDMLQAIDDLQTSDRAVLLPAVVSAIVVPLARCLDEPESYFLRFNRNLIVASDRWDTPWSELRPSTDDSLPATGLYAAQLLEATLPDGEPRRKDVRMRFAFALQLNALAQREELEADVTRTDIDRDTFVEELIAAMIAILQRT